MRAERMEPKDAGPHDEDRRRKLGYFLPDFL